MTFSIRKVLKPIFCLIMFYSSLIGFAQENCSNGFDDDGDGLIDLNDTQDCFCQGISSNIIGNIIPNSSFELMDCCPDWYSTIVTSSLDCVEGWDQATEATSDYLHNCDFMPSIVPQPLPNGDGVVGAFAISTIENSGGILFGGQPYLEYIGNCLESTMLADQEYTISFSITALRVNGLFTESYPLEAGPIDITIFGFNSCPSFPLPIYNCPVSEGWYELGSVTYEPEDVWSELTISYTPMEDTEAIMLGGPCILDDSTYEVVDESPGMYFIYDGLVLIDPFYLQSIEISGGNCVSDLVLTAEESAGLTYQWYYEGVALAGENVFSLNLGESGFDEGIYQVLITNTENGSCTVLETEVTSTSGTNLLDFEANVTSGCVPLEVGFNNLTSASFIESAEWSFETGSSDVTNPDFTFDTPGVYTVTLTVETPDGCVTSFSKEDYIEVFENPSSEITYEVLEECNPFVLGFESNASAGVIHTWDFGLFGSSSEADPVWPFYLEGTYEVFLEVLDGNTGCSSGDSIWFNLSVSNPPKFNFDGASWICADSIAVIEAIYDNGAISWLEGGSGSSLEISAPGMYHAIFTRDDGCVAIDSIFVPLKPLPTLSATDKVACIGDAVQLYADSDAPKVYWENVSHNPVAMVYDAGIYMAIAKNECGITSKEIEVVLNDCSCHIYIPNAFSPNGDGINDLFKPSISCDLQYYEMLIFDRWGGKVFATNDPEKSWNGGSLNNPDYFLEPNIYNYIIFYDNVLQPKMDRQKKTGFVQLLR